MEIFKIIKIQVKMFFGQVNIHTCICLRGEIIISKMFIEAILRILKA